MSEETDNALEQPQAARFSNSSIEKARKFFAGPVDFVIGVAKLAQLPASDRPEICFAGRSNVGKSSLVNALTGRKTLARTSNTPGRTQQLNFFAMTDKAWLVDLPGYGFAQAPKPMVDAWNRVIRNYLSGRPNLSRVFVLIDSRHGLKPVDMEILDMLDVAAVVYQIVLTKSDKVKKTALEKVIKDTKKALERRPAAYPHVSVTSSEKKLGIEELRADMAAIAGLVPPPQDYGSND